APVQGGLQRVEQLPGERPTAQVQCPLSRAYLVHIGIVRTWNRSWGESYLPCASVSWPGGHRTGRSVPHPEEDSRGAFPSPDPVARHRVQLVGAALSSRTCQRSPVAVSQGLPPFGSQLSGDQQQAASRPSGSLYEA